MQNKDIGYLIKNINDRLKVKADADLKSYNLTLAQSRVLAFLNENGGEATQKEIEVFLEVSHPTVVGIVSRMVQNGHVFCHIDEYDKRNKIVSLTDSAKAMSMDMKRNILANESKMMSGLSDEDIEHLKKMLTVIYNNIK